MRELGELTQMCPLDRRWLKAFDQQLGGPCVTAVTSKDRPDRYAVENQAIFQPLQYCAIYLRVVTR
jgi:hypothetical protein